MLTKTRIAPCFLFAILKTPVIKAAAAMPITTTFKVLLRATFEYLCQISTITQEDRNVATAKPTDHQPKAFFGRILIRIFITSVCLQAGLYYLTLVDVNFKIDRKWKRYRVAITISVHRDVCVMVDIATHFEFNAPIMLELAGRRE
jgi:hypothetical protein